ncbi:cytochrome c oxidase subunit 3 [Marinobacteraceae bacterium S3BR75-40.1]
MATNQSYYVPEQSKWPIVGTFGILFTLGGTGSVMVNQAAGDNTSLSWTIFCVGVAILLFMFFGWFGSVIKESRQGLYSDQMERSFRWGMSWFIFSEVMFFAAFFGALFYARMFAVPWLGGEGAKGDANMLWEGFQASWPLLNTPNPETYPAPEGIIDPWHIPFINTILLLSSSVTVTIAHKALKHGKRNATVLWTGITVLLGAIFLGFQIHEYIQAYQELNLKLTSGIYGSTFFMLTGFHGAHVTLGAIILTVITIRVAKGHFTAEHHFGFEAASWYWHFVDVVWVGLFTFVYVL